MQRAVNSVTRPIGNFFSGLAHLPSLEQRQPGPRAPEPRPQRADRVDRLPQGEQYRRSPGAARASRARSPPMPCPAVVTGTGLSNFEWTVTIDQRVLRRHRGQHAGGHRGPPRAPSWWATSCEVSVERIHGGADHRSQLVGRGRARHLASGGDRRGPGRGGHEDGRSCRRARPITGNEPVFTQGYCVGRPAGTLPTRHPRRRGVAHASVRQRDRRRRSACARPPTSPRCSSCWCSSRGTTC